MLAFVSLTTASLQQSTSAKPAASERSAPAVPPKRNIQKEEWNSKLAEVKIAKEDMNALVMNFLVIEGYKEAAEKFQQESGTKPSMDLNSIGERMAIRSAIQQGNIEHGIEKVNDLNPSILDSNPQLIFHLRQQQLIELIRKGSIEEALKFAQEELALRGESNPAFLEELEKTMALLAFDASTDSVMSGGITAQFDPTQRQKIASELNAAILTSQFQEKEPKLPTILKMLLWTQQQLEEKATFPKLTAQGQPSS